MSRVGKSLVLAGVWALTLTVGEALTRTLLRTDIPEARRDERALCYSWHPELGWFPIPGSTYLFEGGTVPIHVRHNAEGFRDREHGKKDRPRLAILGDSFVWGYDAEEGARFTDLLATRFPAVEVFNLGVSGYGTDQELLLMKREFDAIAPDAVVLIFCRLNDHNDNITNFRYEGYFKPYFEKTPDGLRLRGVPVPRSFPFYLARYPLPFRSHLLRFLAERTLRIFQPAIRTVPDPTNEIFDELDRFLRERHVPLFVGMAEPDPGLAAHLDRLGVPWTGSYDVSRFQGNGLHWTPDGHRDVAQKLAHFLGEKGVLRVLKN